MGANNKTVVRLTFPDAGADGSIQHWTQFELRDTYSDPIGSLKFQCAPEKKDRKKYRDLLVKGRIVTLFINEVNQGGYLITTVRKTISPSGGVVYDFECKSPLCTPYEGSVDPDLKVSTQTDTPVTTVVLEALNPYGFDRISGDGAASVGALTGKPVNGGKAALPVDTLTHQEAHAEEGQTAYAFASRIFARVGVCLRMAPDGQLLLGAPDYDQNASYALVQDPERKQQGDYFTGEIEITTTNDGQFSECRVRGQADDKSGQKSAGRPDVTVTAADVNPTRPAYQSDGGAAYKPLIIRDKHSRDRKRCESVGKLALGTRAKDAFTISGAVDGFVAKTGAIWQVNTTVDVYIAEEGIREKMWIMERVMTQDLRGGQQTRLRVLPLGAYVLGNPPGGS
jgi:hypothetical protein